MKGKTANRQLERSFDAADIIDQWLSEQRQSHLYRADLKNFCEANQRNVNRIIAYLRAKGLAVSNTQVKAWMDRYGIKPGPKAIEFNEGYKDFVGMETLGVLEKILYQNGRIMNAYIEIIDEAISEGSLSGQQLQSVIAQLPALAKEARQIVQQIETTKNNTAYNELILAGAQQFRKIMMEQVKDKPEERWLRELSEGVFTRILEYLGEAE